MNDLSGMLGQLLGGQADQIGARIGTDRDQALSAMQAALPAVLAAVGQQAATPGGQAGLRNALERDHDGAILDDLPGYLQGTANLSNRTTNGEGILGHVLGEKQPAVQQALSQQTGLSLGTIAQLLPLLAPIVMGMLGKQARSDSGEGGGLDLGSILSGLGGLGGLEGGGSAAGSGGLDDLLGSILGPKSGR